MKNRKHSEQNLHTTKDVITLLEKEHKNRGLKFNAPFVGLIPVQAFGEIDGMRFYFRFRGNWGSLKVGPYEREFEELYAQRVQEDEDKRVKQGYDEWIDIVRSTVVEESDPHFMPHRIVKIANCEGENPEDVYNGNLTAQESYLMFNKLVAHLITVPENEQLDEGTMIWLRQGREAHNEWKRK